MNINTIKSEIYRKLDELDEEQLQIVNEMVSTYLKKTDDEELWVTLSDEDNAAIEEGLQHIERGEFYTFEEVRQRIHKKLYQYGLSD